MIFWFARSAGTSVSVSRDSDPRASLALTWLLGLTTILAGWVAPEASHSPPTASLSADTTTITIRSTSAAMAFLPDYITVKAGTPIRIRYVNESSFAHNLVVVKSEDDIDVIGAASFDAGETGFVPMQHTSKMIAYSPLAAAGKTVELTFTAPPPGSYPFVCFVDGHFNMMIGTLESLK